MKKLLSLTLVAIMLLSTVVLTSCDAIWAALTSDRYVVFESEWESLLNSTNFTVEYKTNLVDQDENVRGQHIQKIMAEEDAYRVDSDGEPVSCRIYENGIVYSFEKNGTTWEKHELEGEDWVSIKLVDCIEGLSEMNFFETFVFNETTQSYILEKDGEKSEFTFINGKLEKGTIGNVYTIYDVNKTVVRVPGDDKEDEGNDDTEILPPQSSGITRPENGSPVTEAEWLAAMNETNFGSLTFSVEYTGGQEIHTPSRIIHCCDEMVLDSSRTSVKINGFWYDLTSNGGGYTAEITLENRVCTIARALGMNPSFSEVTYDTDKGCYYYVEGNYNTDGSISVKKTYIYFVNGKINYIEKTKKDSEVIESYTSIRSIGSYSKQKLMSEYGRNYIVNWDGDSIDETAWTKLLSENNFTAKIEGSKAYVNTNNIWHSTPFKSEIKVASDKIQQGELNNPEKYYLLENGVWYLIDYHSSSLTGEGGYIKSVSDTNPAASVRELLIENHFTDLGFNTLVYNSTLKAYESECNYVFGGVNVHANILVKILNASHIEIYIASNTKGKATYIGWSQSDPVMKITISGIGETEVEIPEYAIAE